MATANPFGAASSRTDSFSVHPEDLVIIGLDTQDGPEHPLYDERILLPLDEKMVANIGALGVQVPVLTQRLEDGRTVVLDGRQRVRHAREANARAVKAGGERMRIPVAAPKKVDDQRAVSVMVSANEFRQDDDVVVKAKKARKLADDFGMKPSEIAALYRVSSQAVFGWLKLSDAAPELLAEVSAGTISATAASHMTALPQETQKEKAKAIKEKAATAPKTRAGKVKKVTVDSAKAEAKAAKAPDADVIQAPGKRLLKDIVAQGFGDPDAISQDFLKGIEYVLGNLRPERVAGLVALIRKVQGE